MSALLVRVAWLVVLLALAAWQWKPSDLFEWAAFAPLVPAALLQVYYTKAAAERWNMRRVAMQRLTPLGLVRLGPDNRYDALPYPEEPLLEGRYVEQG